MANIYGIEFSLINTGVYYAPGDIDGLVLSINVIENNQPDDQLFHNIIYTTLSRYVKAELVYVELYSSRKIAKFEDYIVFEEGDENHYTIPMSCIKQHVDKNALRYVLEEKRNRIDDDINTYCPQNVKSARNV